MNNLLSFNDYKAYLRKHIATTQVSMTTLAAAAGCQRSYLSRVLNSEINLTPEHALNLSDYWRLKDFESSFFLTLVDYARAGTPALRKRLIQRLTQIKQEHESLDRVVNRPKNDAGPILNIYYSAWYWTAIHIGTSIPELQSAEALSLRLNLPISLVTQCLGTLKDIGFVKQSGKRWMYAGGGSHVPSGSSLVVNHHNNWRSRAVLSAQEGNPENTHFTVVQSMSANTYQKIRQMFLEFIQAAAAEAGPSKEEQLVILNCDLFKM